MISNWQEAFNMVPELAWKEDGVSISKPLHVRNLQKLKRFLDLVQIKLCLLRPFFETQDYPVVNPQELLPSFESNLYEYVHLPGFSMVILDRPLDYFQEIFQFDILHCVEDAVGMSNGPVTPLEPAIVHQNQQVFLSRLPKLFQDQFREEFGSERITELQAYPRLLAFLLQMDRGHVLAKNAAGDFYLSGIYASFPSDLDSELKRFGLRIGKFRPEDNVLYELNRNFVYQFLMELYGFPIVSERRTSAALFARRLFKGGEDFMIRVLGQSDRTITSLYSSQENRKYPKVEKLALVSVDKSQKEQLRFLKKRGYLLQDGKQAVILRVVYRQHKYDPNNVRTDRALSVERQEIVHPWTGEVCSTVNIIKDTSLMTYVLNDIVKGEYYGRIKYKRNEIVENTDTHSKRLKFLYAWLKKHQRRIIGYSDEFYDRVVKVLDNYLLNPDFHEVFQDLNDIYQEVWRQYSYIQQARKVKQLEDLRRRRFKGSDVNYLEMLKNATSIIKDLKFELVKYFDSLVNQAVYICEGILNDRYLLKKYVQSPESSLTSYGKQVRWYYGQLVKLLDELQAIRKARRDSSRN
ncbi:MAG: hypothetical protein ACLFRL_00935 [Desulfohalobiaceae bacterium]